MFSGLMLILAGSFTIVHALAAIQKSNYLADHVLFSSCGAGGGSSSSGDLRGPRRLRRPPRAHMGDPRRHRRRLLNCLGQLSWADDLSGLGALGDGARRARHLRAHGARPRRRRSSDLLERLDRRTSTTRPGSAGPRARTRVPRPCRPRRRCRSRRPAPSSRRTARPRPGRRASGAPSLPCSTGASAWPSTNAPRSRRRCPSAACACTISISSSRGKAPSASSSPIRSSRNRIVSSLGGGTSITRSTLPCRPDRQFDYPTRPGVSTSPGAGRSLQSTSTSGVPSARPPPSPVSGTRFQAVRARPTGWA